MESPVTSIRVSRVLAVIIVVVLSLSGAHASAAKPEWYLARNLALSGYDAVAYFTESRAVRGDARFELVWNGVRWRFASLEHRDRFRAEPGRYAPRFGGYCAWAVSNGYTASGDPNAWSVVDGRLYLNYSPAVRRTWEQDKAGNIARGTANWPGVLEK
jgi:hypothetical protein